MAEAIDLVLEHLKNIQKQITALKADFRDLKVRTSAMQQSQGRIMTLPGALNERMDRPDARLARIGRRLGLSDA
jgi:hypothetical protein